MKLPEGWKEVELGEVFNFEKKSSIQAGQGNKIGKYKFFTSSDIQSKRIDEAIYDGEYLIFSTGGSAGIHYCNEKFSTSTDCFVVNIDSQVKAKYVYYYLSANIYLLEEGFKGLGLKHISKEYLKKIRIIYPENKNLQSKIISILEKVEKIKQHREEADNLMKKYAYSVFYDLFGSLPKNSKKFEVIPMNDIIDTMVDMGSNGSNATVAKNLIMSDKEDYAIMIRTVNFTANNFVDNMKYVSKEVYDFFSKSQIFGGEIIMNKIGSAGKIWLMPRLGKPVSLGLNQLAIRVKGIDPVYLFWYLETDYMKKKIQEKVGGAVTKSITKGAVRELEIILPPKDLQKEFVSIIKKIETTKKRQDDVSKNIDNIFNALMQKAFKGELI